MSSCKRFAQKHYLVNIFKNVTYMNNQKFLTKTLTHRHTYRVRLDQPSDLAFLENILIKLRLD